MLLPPCPCPSPRLLRRRQGGSSPAAAALLRHLRQAAGPPASRGASISSTPGAGAFAAAPALALGWGDGNGTPGPSGPSGSALSLPIGGGSGSQSQQLPPLLGAASASSSGFPTAPQVGGWQLSCIGGRPGGGGGGGGTGSQTGGRAAPPPVSISILRWCTARLLASCATVLRTLRARCLRWGFAGRCPCRRSPLGPVWVGNQAHASPSMAHTTLRLPSFILWAADARCWCCAAVRRTSASASS